jgi:hypothetical protein
MTMYLAEGRFNGALALLICICGACRPGWGQNDKDSVLRSGSFEIGVLAGDTIGGLLPSDVPLANFSGFRVTSPGSGAFAVNVARAVSRRLLFFGQVNVWKGRHEDRSLPAGYSASTNLLNLVYEGGFEWAPLRNRGRFEPYVLVAGSTIQKRVDVIVNYANPSPNPAPTEVLGGATRVRFKDAVFAPAMGAGIRYYFGHRFGIRMETKAYFPTGDVPRATGVASCGLFVDIP